MSNFLETVRWDWVGNAFQIALCAGILAGWLRRRIKGRSAPPEESAAAGPVFAQEIALQAFRQQAEQALQRILTVVEAERDRLQLAWAGGRAPSRAAEAESGGPADAAAAFRWGDPEADGAGHDRYGALDELAQQGLSSRQIADRLNLPAGEIELALKLRKGGHDDHPVEGTRQ